ncbi:hypothetical protein F5884DRAFT_664247 [Xylogone sp. PMI_703]|nr:hypothetical protein F5884DRAFT_664247 [Xylogone sp. PMI_703]
MQRPRNRQGRQPQSDRGRGRGRGASHGGFCRQTATTGSVPGTDQVINGAAVSIVLKVDQPTGREVQGFVAEILTNGNHPRGIKVRLVDGRVGRVQRMVSEDEARTASAGLSGLGRNGEISNGSPAETPNSRTRMRYRDIREEANMATPKTVYNLEDFLPVGHPLREDSEAGVRSASANSSSNVETLLCPVCGQFKGDEAAVSHHVATHFD